MSSPVRKYPPLVGSIAPSGMRISSVIWLSGVQPSMFTLDVEIQARFQQISLATNLFSITQQRRWSRHYAPSRKVARSILVETTGVSNRCNPSSRKIAYGPHRDLQVRPSIPSILVSSEPICRN
jgi:hypothetical protein